MNQRGNCLHIIFLTFLDKPGHLFIKSSQNEIFILIDVSAHERQTIPSDVFFSHSHLSIVCKLNDLDMVVMGQH